MNDRNDFLPEVRNASWWSGDSRMAANGRANEAVLQKIGLMEREDLSQVEAVQMGHVMQPVIGRLVQDRLHLELKDFDIVLQNDQNPWLKSHFDFITTDGKTLVEAKNYSASVRNKFSAETNLIPAADMAQLIHESACAGVDNVILAVLFGGNELQTFQFTITDEQRTELIQEMAVYWAAVQHKEPLKPETTLQARKTWPIDNGGRVTAPQDIERVCHMLTQVKASIKTLEQQEEELLIHIQNCLGGNSELVTVDGKVLATWKTSKSSKKFDQALFAKAYPEMYQQFFTEVPGSRRFLLKG